MKNYLAPICRAKLFSICMLFFLVILPSELFSQKHTSPLPFNQSAIKQCTAPALKGPDALIPYFHVRLGLPVPPSDDERQTGVLVGISAFMSLMFPTIYGIALTGVGDDAKFGAAGLIMAILRGSILPPLQGLIIDLGGPEYNDLSILGVSEVKFSFMIPLICLAVVAWYGYRTITKYDTVNSKN